MVDWSGDSGVVSRREALALCVGAFGSTALSLVGCAGKQEGEPEGVSAYGPSVPIEEILENMSLDEKVSQLIVPAIAEAGAGDAGRWNGSNITSLDETPQLGGALRRHQYGGVCLLASNVQGIEQTCRLTNALQAINAGSSSNVRVPYLVCADGEGGVVVRLNMGTRMVGAMAVGATGKYADANAQTMGRVLGSELASLGINVDLAPDADVNVNPANPVIGVRSFGDDPERVGELASAMAKGIAESGIVACYKHFPGHGDTGTDSHLGTATVDKSLDELRACELVPFAQAVQAGADLIMTAHITCPQLDDEQPFADGSFGHYPATMSGPILTGILREELGYDGVIITDSLTMEAIASVHLVEGEAGSATYAANVAQKVIEAGGDILLNPRDLVSDEAAAFYDELIDLVCGKVESGEIAGERIDQSVRRVLALKEAHGLLLVPVDAGSLDERIATARDVVGSSAHHDEERDIARNAITLTKNDGVLPLVGKDGGNYVLLVCTAQEAALAKYAVSMLQEMALLPEDTLVDDLVTGQGFGSKTSVARVTIDAYYDVDKGVASISQAASSAMAQADAVICETTTWGTAALASDSEQRKAIESILAATHAAGVRFVQLSDNLPYDVARYLDADAQVVAYMSTGTGVDPTNRADSADAPAYNANFLAALEVIFGGCVPTGTLPVNVPVLYDYPDGTVTFGEELLYERGYGLTY